MPVAMNLRRNLGECRTAIRRTVCPHTADKDDTCILLINRNHQVVFALRAKVVSTGHGRGCRHAGRGQCCARVGGVIPPIHAAERSIRASGENPDTPWRCCRRGDFHAPDEQLRLEVRHGAPRESTIRGAPQARRCRAAGHTLARCIEDVRIGGMLHHVIEREHSRGACP